MIDVERKINKNQFKDRLYRAHVGDRLYVRVLKTGTEDFWVKRREDQNDLWIPEGPSDYPSGRDPSGTPFSDGALASWYPLNIEYILLPPKVQETVGDEFTS